MSKFDVIFGMVDKMGSLGMLTMWLAFYTTTVICMLVDDTEGKIRDFSLLSQVFCCINLCTLGWAITKRSNVVETSLLTVNTDLAATIVAWAYFGGDVFSSSAIGVFNYFHVIFAFVMFINNLAGFVVIATDYDGWVEFKGENQVGAAGNRANV
ncbi:uncharacterized protein METZ01_LOCUS178538 [marine metagenome]|uniref:Uncharacterized protein n=1 Tax=marine metagenome TaxID=408172 RepID=A0A382CIM4_9ZZZZ|tara:strand:+ start:4904 stop:5365 length:462 start_codon:yes stop_codon:yes gene_type:complete